MYCSRARIRERARERKRRFGAKNSRLRNAMFTDANEFGLFSGVNMAQGGQAHGYHFAFLDLVDTDLVNTLDIALAIGKGGAADFSGIKFLDLVKALLEHGTPGELFKGHFLHGQA